MARWEDQRQVGRPAPAARLEVAVSSPGPAHAFGPAGLSGLLSTVEPSEPGSLNQLVAQATQQVHACSGAAAALWRGGEPIALAASHPSLPDLIDVQVRCGRGPSLDALGGDEPVCCPDTLEERRWPEYASEALRQGVRCSISLAYRSGAAAVSLSLFGARPRTLGPDSVAAAERLVAFGGAVVGLASEYGEARRTAQQLRDAADSRAVVDQAKGVLMHALGCTADEALQRMRQVSQAANVKVTDIATRVIESRGADGLAMPR
jgi:ANTAR domain